jgi:hypothetical protein
MCGRAVVTAICLAAGAVHGAEAQRQSQLIRTADSLIPYVEGASGLVFRRPPRLGLRSHAEVRRYVDETFRREFSTDRITAVATAYRLLGLLPDTAGFARLVVDLHAEELRGYYDPQTDSLFCLEGSTPLELREVMAHELVHAVQAQYEDLTPNRERAWDSDVRTAFHSLLEGQATFATMRLLAPRRNVVAETAIWDYITSHLRAGPMARPAYRRAPLWLREGLLAPYLYGAQFVNFWHASNLADTLPFGPRLPVSTEQIHHFDRYVAGDRPVRLRFRADGGAGTGAGLAEDVVGELEIQMLAAEMAKARALGRLAPIGWGGDRFRLLATPDGAALVWYVVWDDAESAAAFRKGTGAKLAARRIPGYRVALDSLTVGAAQATRYVVAPAGWAGWGALPEVEVVGR